MHTCLLIDMTNFPPCGNQKQDNFKGIKANIFNNCAPHHWLKKIIIDPAYFTYQLYVPFLLLSELCGHIFNYKPTIHMCDTKMDRSHSAFQM